MAGCHLRADVADHLVRLPDVGPDEAEHRRLRLAVPVERQDRNLEAFLINIAALERGQAPAHVEVMDDHEHMAHQDATAKDRPRHGDVDEVAAGEPGIVGDEDVPGRRRDERGIRQEAGHGEGQDP